MQVDGKEFLRNVGIEQDKERLTQEQKRLEELKRASVKSEEDYMNMEANQNDSAFVDLSLGNKNTSSDAAEHHEVEDIILDTNTAQNNKKKYIMLGFGLVLLFIITVLVIRLISNNETEKRLETTQTTTQAVRADDILNKIDSNEEYQKVIERKNKLNETVKNTQKEKENLNDLEIPAQQASNNVPLVIDTPKPKIEPKRDLFGLDKETQKVIEKVVAKKVVQEPKQIVPAPKKQIVIPTPKETKFAKKSTTIAGYFIQIGAFTKEPNRNLIKKIVTKGYNYKVHPVTIKGKVYNKVLIGPFTTRASATQKLNQVKVDFKNPNSYILKF